LFTFLNILTCFKIREKVKATCLFPYMYFERLSVAKKCDFFGGGGSIFI